MTKFKIILTTTGSMPGGKSVKMGRRHYETDVLYSNGNTQFFNTRDDAEWRAKWLVNSKTNGVDSARVEEC